VRAAAVSLTQAATGGVAAMTLSPDETARFWNHLLEYLEEGRVVPIVGQGLLTVQLEGRQVPLYTYLAERLAEYLHLRDFECTPNISINSVVCRYLATGGDLEDIYPALKMIMVKQDELPIPEALVKLAALEPFKLFVSTTFDSLLETAINRVRFGGQARTLSFSYAPDTVGDLPGKLQDLPGPAVFHLLGKLSAVPQYAVTDEDTLEFFHALQCESRRPRLLLDELTQRHLLIIGTGVSSWSARFFIRIAKRERLFLARGKTDIVADSAIRDDPELVVFLEHFSARTKVFQGGGAEFVDELHGRWRARHPLRVEGPTICAETPPPGLDMERGSVFLSYASEDRAIVEGIRTALEEKGVAVWFDREGLSGGDEYEVMIKRNIEGASLFVPIISQHSLTAARRFFRVEWDQALRVAVQASVSQRFIIPVAIDDTSEQDPAVPFRFRELHWVRLAGGKATQDFVDLIRRLFRDYQKSVLMDA
jgi:TIR domain/SIR2-like domain